MWYPREFHIRTKFPPVPIAPGDLDRAATPEVKPVRSRSDPALLRRKKKLSPIASTFESTAPAPLSQEEIESRIMFEMRNISMKSSSFGHAASANVPGPESGLISELAHPGLGQGSALARSLPGERFPNMSGHGFGPSSQTGTTATGSAGPHLSGQSFGPSSQTTSAGPHSSGHGFGPSSQTVSAGPHAGGHRFGPSSQTEPAGPHTIGYGFGSSSPTVPAGPHTIGYGFGPSSQTLSAGPHASGQSFGPSSQTVPVGPHTISHGFGPPSQSGPAGHHASGHGFGPPQSGPAGYQGSGHGFGPPQSGPAGHAGDHSFGPPSQTGPAPPVEEEDVATRLKRQAKAKELDTKIATCIDQVRRMLRERVKQGFAEGKGKEGDMQPRASLSKLKLVSSAFAVDSLQDYLQSAFERMQTTVGDKLQSETEEYHSEVIAQRNKVEQAQKETKEGIEQGRERETNLIQEIEQLNQKTKAMQKLDEQAMEETKDLALELRKLEAERSTMRKTRLKKEHDATTRIDTLLSTQQSELSETQTEIEKLRAELEETIRSESTAVEECRQRSEEETRETLLPEEEVCARLREVMSRVHHEEECAENEAKALKCVFQDLMSECWDELRLRMPPQCPIPSKPSKKGLKHLARKERFWQHASIRQLRLAKSEAEVALRDLSERELPKVAAELQEAHASNDVIKEDLAMHAEILGEQAATNGVLGVQFDEATSRHDQMVSVYEESRSSSAVRQLQQMARCITSTSKKTTESEQLWRQTQKLQEQMSASNARTDTLIALTLKGQSNIEMMDEQIAALEAELEAARGRTGDFGDRGQLMDHLNQTQVYMDQLSSKLQCAN